MRVLLADAQPVFRLGASRLVHEIDAAAEIVEAGDAATARAAASAARLDLVLLDPGLPGVDPLDGIGAAVGMFPDVPVVVVAAAGGRHDAVRALDSGAMGFIPRTATPEEFVRMLRVVLAGGLCLPKSFPAEGERPWALAAEPPAAALAGLTRRQRQVLFLLTHGLSNIEIADSLGVSDKTVRIHVSDILKALGVRNRTQAALIAARAIAGAPAAGGGEAAPARDRLGRP